MMVGALLCLNSAWFEVNQPMLQRMANTPVGREVLGIDPGLSDIVALRPNSVTARISGKSCVSTFSPRPKYARIIGQRWPVFQELAHHLDRHWQQVNSLWYPPAALMAATVTSFNPDANPESTSVDGHVFHSQSNQLLSTLVNGVGSAASDSADEFDAARIIAGNITDRYSQIYRGFLLFDTSALPDTDIIDSARLRIDVKSKVNTLSGEGHDNSRMVVVASTPASNTALAASDYAQVGSTSFGESALQQDLLINDYNNITLNANGLANITATGVSKFATRYKWDFSAVTTGFTWADGGQQRTQAHASELGTRDPELEVTHSAAPQRAQSSTATRMITGGLL